MKVLKVFHDQVEAQMAKALLASNGFQVELQGAKDYMGHLMGGGAGKYSLLIPDTDFNEAEKLLDSVPNDPSAPASPKSADSHFRRAVILAFAGALILPLIMNIGSLYQLREFWKKSEKTKRDRLRVAFVLSLQLLTVFVLALFVRQFDFSLFEIV